MATQVFTATAARRVYLAVLKPYDPTASAVKALYVGTAGFKTKPTDTPANTYFEPVLQDPGYFARAIYSGEKLGGRSLPDRGRMVLTNAGEFDDWLAHHWDGRQVTLYAGEESDAWADFEIVFEGLCGELQYSRNAIELPLRDQADVLDKLVQETLFAGTGGNEGGDDLKDKPKPVCLGEVYNIVPVLVDSTSRVYQFHDGQVEAVSAVYDNGKLLTLTADYTVDLTQGRLTLVAAAGGLITADVKGDKTGGVYAASAGAVARRLVTKYGGLTDPGDLDTTALSALDTATTAPVGVYMGTTELNLADVLDQVVGSVGGFWGYTRAGLFTVGRVEDPAGGTAELVLDETDLTAGGIRRAAFGKPHWRERLNYKRAWAVQLPDALDAAATDAHKDFVAQEYRTAAAKDEDIKADGAGKGGYIGAIDPDPETTLLAVKADADAEATRRLTLTGERRDLFHVSVKTQGLPVDLGAIVSLTHGRFGLAAGKDLLLVGMRADAWRNQVDLDLWG